MTTRPAGLGSEFPEALSSRCGYGPYRALVTRVIDGDTLDVLVDLGWFTYLVARVRVAGVDTPETFAPKTSEERQAGLRATQWVTSTVLNQPVILTTEKDHVTFGRFVARVQYLDATGAVLDLTDELVRLGLGTAIR